MRINSVNPLHGGSEGGEGRVADWVEGFLHSLNLKTERWDVFPGRPNLRVVVPGEDSTRTILFNTHVDTVSITGMTIDPTGGEVRDGRLWGRGSTDAKGQVTAMIHALAAVAQSGRRPPVNIQLVLTMDEEAGFSGIRNLVRRGVKADAAVIGEPTDLRVVVAHKGTQRWWITVEGRSAHSAKPHLGINSIHHAAHLIRRIQEDYTRELAGRFHPLLGSPTVNVSKIEGGTQVNLVPHQTRLLIDRRALPGESRSVVHAEFEKMFEEIRRDVPNFRARQEEPLLVDPPLETATDHPFVRVACAIAAEQGRDAQPAGVPYGTDGSKLSEIGIPTIVVGPGSIDQAHTADEFIVLDELVAGARYYFDLMMAGLER